jgi:hypothetical protein
MTEAVQVALIAALPSTIIATGSLIQSILNGRQGRETAKKVGDVATQQEMTHKEINSKLSGALVMAEAKGHAEGIIKGAEQEQARVAGESISGVHVIKGD